MFVARQFREIKAGDWKVFLRKLRLGALIGVDAVLVVMAIPIVLFVRIVQPIWWVRFGYFSVDRIGHFVFDVEYFQSERKLGIQERASIDIFFFNGNPANEQFEKMSKRTVTTHPLIRYLYNANELVPFGARHRILPARERTNSRDLKGVLNSVETQIGFTDSENHLGQQFLNEIGFGVEEKFICLVVRDSAYLNKTQGDRDWSYHGFRDTDIDDYETVALELAHQGYGVFRMGKFVEKPFQVAHPKIFDYANSKFRADLLDIWLMANCWFAISTGLGLDSVADIFRRPIVFVNYLPILDLEAWGSYITVPKHLTWSSNKQPLSLQEQLEYTSVNSYYYNSHGIDINDLTPRQISDATLEMEARLTGRWEETQEDVDLQKRAWLQLKSYSKYHNYHKWIHPDARIGAKFLRESQDWFL